MELWDLYTADRELLGKYHVRGEQLPENTYHLVVHVWIKNRNGQYLMSQRAANRPTHPLMWESVGGAVLKGEDSLQGALREVKEETGIELDAKAGKVVFTKTRKCINGIRFNDILDVWVFEYDGEVDLSTATTEEVAQTKWLSYAQIKELYDTRRLVDSLSYFFEETI